MSVNRRLVLLVLLVAGMLGSRSAHASYAHMSFWDLVEVSELIVEGKVTEQEEINKDVKDFGRHVYRKVSTFEISRVHKGDIQVGDTVSVLSDCDFICSTNRLKDGVSYLLMLKRQSDRYVDVNNGQGTYLISHLSDGRATAMNSASSPRPTPLLDEIRADLAWTMAKPETPASEPAITEEAAREIACKTLADTGVDLGRYEETKTKLFKEPVTQVGFAYEGDLIWLFDWEVPGTSKQSPRPRDSFAYCYVNAQTGKARCGPNKEQ